LAALIKNNSKTHKKYNLQRDKLFGDFAPVVTEAASNGSKLAQRVCVQAAEEIAAGIRLVGDCFKSETVLTALVGSVANSAFIKKTVGDILSGEKHRLAEPALPPVFGAVMAAMQLNDIEIEISEQVKNNLLKGYEIILKEEKA